jgi:N-acetylmuramoyl-L-alanine amidase
MTRSTTELLIVHCSATPPSMDIGKREIDRWHRARGWLGIGYHFVIRQNGRIETGRSIERAGAHAYGYNDKSIGICLVGGVQEDDKTTPEQNFSTEQYRALEALLFQLKRDYPEAEVIGHRDVSSKACPSFDVKTWWADRQDRELCSACGQPVLPAAD